MSVLEEVKRRRHERTGLDYSDLELKITGNVWWDIEDAMKRVEEYERARGYDGRTGDQVAG